MDHFDDDDYDERDYRQPSDLRKAEDVVRSMGGIDQRKGTVSLFGINLKVGTAAATVLKPFYDQVINKVAREGGKHAFRYGYDIAKSVSNSSPLAYKVARASEFVWGFGPTLADVGLNIKKSVGASYRDMHGVRDILAPYLAANHNMNTSVTSLMTDSNHGVRNLRAFVMKKSKNSLMSNFADFASRVPSLMLVYWQRKIDDIKNPERARSAFDDPQGAAANARVEELTKLGATGDDGKNEVLSGMTQFLEEMKQEPEYRRGNYSNPFQYALQNHPLKLFSELQKNPKQLFKQLTRPTHANELEANLTFLNCIPLAGGLISQLLTNHLVSRDSRNIDDFAVVKAAALAARLKKNPSDDPAELADEITRLFRQQFVDSGGKAEIKQSCGHKLHKLSAELAEAIVGRGLNPYAIIDLVCDDKLVKMEKGELIFTPTHERSELIEKQFTKYNVKVDNKEFWHDAGVKPEDAKNIYAALPADERGFFVMLFPPGILEQLGVDKRELAKIRRTNRDEFLDTFSKVLIGMKDYSTEDLTKQYGVPEQVAKLALSAAEDYADVMKESGRRSAENYLEKNQRDIGKTVVETILASKKPGDYLTTLMKGGPAGISPGEIMRSREEQREAGEDLNR